jgi:hypothetical protein
VPVGIGGQPERLATGRTASTVRRQAQPPDRRVFFVRDVIRATVFAMEELALSV